MATRILIVYESKNGQTQKIAKFMSDHLTQRGGTVEMMSMKHILPVDFDSYDGVVVGAPIYMRNYSTRFRKWIGQHSEALNKKQAAFFSVCMQVLTKDEDSQRDLLAISDNFFKNTGWYPRRRKVFAGGVCFSRYNVFVRFIMRYLSKRAGQHLDTRRDYEFTNWTDVTRFSDDFFNSLQLRREVSVEAPLN